MCIRDRVGAVLVQDLCAGQLLGQLHAAGRVALHDAHTHVVFQQTVYSFKAFQEAIDDYSTKAEHYQADIDVYKRQGKFPGNAFPG